MKGFSIQNFFSGLSRQVLFWFLFIALTPAMVISWIGYHNGQEQLHHDTTHYLKDMSAIQTQFIRTNFERMMTDLKTQGETRSNGRFLERLSEEFSTSGQSAKVFTRSFQWATIADEHDADLNAFGKAYGYYDVLLIDLDGNVLYTVAREWDLGENLFDGELSTTRLSKAARQSMDSGQPLFSDLEHYAPSDKIAGFLLNPLLDEIGEPVGLIALQLAGGQLKQLIGQSIEFGQTGRRYLVGEDLTLRTPGALGELYPVLGRKVESRNALKWYQKHQELGGEVLNQSEEMIRYAGPLGQPVIGIHSTLDFAGIHWAYIVEIDQSEAFASSESLFQLTLILMITTVVVVLLIAMPVTGRIVGPIVELSGALSRVGKGDLQQLDIRARHELGKMVRGFNEMILNLQVSEQKTESQHWQQEGAARLMDQMQGDQAITDLARNTISFLCNYLNVQIGAFYVKQGAQIRLVGTHAFSARKGFRNEFIDGEGLVGQAALEKEVITFTHVPDDYLAVTSGLGEVTPSIIMVIPLLWNNKVVALIELGMMEPLNELEQQFIENSGRSIAVAVQTALGRERTQELLIQTQAQSEKLQVREEELRESNTSLENQALELRRSEEQLRNSQAQMEEQNEKLQVQQEELRVANEDLEKKAVDLRQSRDQIETKNRELEIAQYELEARAKELATSSKYKSEFLANMSHELRTPLNSLLILSKLLADNREGNLNAQQVEYSQTIHDSGSDLLNLINDILDLSKIESGKMEVHVETIHLNDFVAGLKSKFQPMAESKGIGFEVEFDQAPSLWRSDAQKLGQVVKNMLSNAMKFTREGSVRLRIGAVPSGIRLTQSEWMDQHGMAISVIDSGIGISREQLQVIFEAFQQADGSTSRKYGGTGLGLSISRELARLLQGEIVVESEEGKGSNFTLVIPRELEVVEGQEHTSAPIAEVQPQAVDKPAAPVVEESEVKEHVHQVQESPAPLPREVVAADGVDDDRETLKPNERAILIIEDDLRFAGILAGVARERGFKVLIATDGEAGLHFADYYQPSGIVLDIGLPNMDGWQVMERLKDGSKTRHIPVHFMSANGQPQDALVNGAVGFLTKPITMEQMAEAFERIEHVVDRPMKRLLLVEDNPVQLKVIKEWIGNGDVKTITASTGEEAQQVLLQDEIDCIVLDLGLPDINGMELLETIRRRDDLRHIPVVVYTGRELDPKERTLLQEYAQSIIVKDVRSPERLLDDTTLFLHRVEANLPEERQRTIRMLHDSESLFEGRKVLLVDDDMRNIFALSAAMQEKSMEVLVANNGVEALEQLDANPDTAIVLMDIMMPEMDGYEAMQRIREQERFAKLPMIALTAKAMKGDRAQCIEAGASDYLTKPVETDKLLSMMRVWLYR